jgi:hypothetical protein
MPDQHRFKQWVADEAVESLMSHKVGNRTREDEPVAAA